MRLFSQVCGTRLISCVTTAKRPVDGPAPVVSQAFLGVGMREDPFTQHLYRVACNSSRSPPSLAESPRSCDALLREDAG